MERAIKTYAAFGAAGIASWIIMLPNLSPEGPAWGTGWVPLATLGLPFALLVTGASVWSSHGQGRQTASLRRHATSAAILAVGMPLAFLSSSPVLAAAARIGAGASARRAVETAAFLLAEAVACAAWSLVVFVSAALVNKRASASVLRTALLVTISAAALGTAASAVSQALWRASVFLPSVSLGEIVGSALVLAMAVNQPATPQPGAPSGGGRTALAGP